METDVDVVVVGGGPAGLSGAVALLRSRRSVLVVDDGSPRNRFAGHMHNYLGREGDDPAALLADGRATVASYGGEVRSGEAVAAAPGHGGFVVELADGTSVTARRLLVTTGLVDELPDVAGLRERWGRDGLHCPFCHGYEVRDQRLVILGTTPMVAHSALMFRQLSEHVTVVLQPGTTLTPDDAAQLAARAVRVVEAQATDVVVAEDRVAGVRLATGEVVAADAVVVAPRFTARSALLESLGLEPVPMEVGGVVVGTYVPSEPGGSTSVPGVRVAGNVTELMAQVVSSAAAGLMAGAALNGELVQEEARAAVEAAGAVGHGHGHGVNPEPGEWESFFDPDAWDERYAGEPVWSGAPNDQLVAEATDLAPGTALDLGAGEGGDVLWLAERGWTVTALDFSPVGLAGIADRAARAGLADLVVTEVGDVRSWTPGGRTWDLVTTHFLHLRDGGMHRLVTELATAVGPGGTLLVVGHDPTGAGHDEWREFAAFWTADELSAMLPDGFDVVTEDRPRERVVEGEPHVVVDVVLVARRR